LKTNSEFILKVVFRTYMAKCWFTGL